MAGENSQDFNRPTHERMTEQKQDAERGLEIGRREMQQHEQQSQRPQRKEGDHPGGSIGDNSPNLGRSQQSQGGTNGMARQEGNGAPDVGGEGPGEFKEQENRFPRQDEQGTPQRQPRGEEEDASGQSS